MAGATPTRTSVKANVLAAAATARSAAAMSPSPPAACVPVDAGDDRHRALDDAREDVGHPVRGRTAPLGEIGAGAEHRPRTREHDGADVLVARRITQRPVQLLEQLRRQGVAVERRVERQRADALAVVHPDQRIRHVAQCRGVRAEDEKRPVVSCAGGRDRRAPAVPKDAAGPLRTGDRAARRGVGGGPDLPRARALPQAGCRGALRPRVRRGLRRHGGRPHLHPGGGGGDGPHQLRWRPDGHRRPDVDVDACAGPLRLP